MGRRRKSRKVVKKVRPKLPTIFKCPNCGHQTITITLDKKKGVALVRCGTCKIHAEVKTNPLYELVDIYGDFLDMYYEGNLEGATS
ncbi:MAG: hypothetical protein ACTSWV_04565 [Candidatus Asgardarchaeia archaeon]